MDSLPTIEALYAAGHWLLTEKRFNDAACIFRSMAQAAPTDERSWLALGACHEGLEQHRIAVELYQVAETVAAPALRCIIARARALKVLGRHDEADATYERAEEAASDHDANDLAKLVMVEREAA